MLAAEDTEGVSGLWFEGQRHFPQGENFFSSAPGPDLLAVKDWLQEYFEGSIPKTSLRLAPAGTLFQQQAWRELLNIPYGSTVTYGELARRLNTGPRAVGGAVGRNPISIIVPCHRVVGTAGELTGYAGGIDIKQKLLEIEQRMGE